MPVHSARLFPYLSKPESNICLLTIRLEMYLTGDDAVVGGVVMEVHRVQHHCTGNLILIRSAALQVLLSGRWIL